MSAVFLPTISQDDLERAAQLIQTAYAPTNSSNGEQIRNLQNELIEIQKRPEAWGLVIPFLNHPDQTVQFFGAHTALVKIARDWDSLPKDDAPRLKDVILDLTAHSAVLKRSRVILSKLYVSLAALALKLVPGKTNQWPDWILNCVTYLSGRGVSTDQILDFLAIIAEEADTADLTGSSKMQFNQTLIDASSMVVQALTTSLTQPDNTNLGPTFKCLEAWLSQIPSSDITNMVPILINLLNSESTFIGASSALQEIMSRSALSDGSGTKTLTEPLLLWLDRHGNAIVNATISAGMADETSHSLCKLLAALGDHSTAYFATNLVSEHPVQPTSPSPTRGYLVQTFLRMTMAYTALPGYYGIDEEESELTLAFWYLFQEALWTVDYGFEPNTTEDEVPTEPPQDEKAMWDVGKAVYRELVQVLTRKVKLPPGGGGWSKDQYDKFLVYRRDVGDTLINAYYILRDGMLEYYISQITERLPSVEQHGWEEIEAVLHCITSIQEPIPIEPNQSLSRLFGADILGRLPTSGQNRIRRTALSLLFEFSSWFTTQPVVPPTSNAPSLLMNAVGYCVNALSEHSLCLAAANALQKLCDDNRAALALHIDAFAGLHAGLTNIPDEEKSRVLQSIASVIEALPPEQAIPPIEAITNPVVERLTQALRSPAQSPEEARSLVIAQLQTLACIAKGLTRTTDSTIVFEVKPEEALPGESILRAREDPRMVRLRESIFNTITEIAQIWYADSSVAGALSELIKAITSLPPDTTLLSLSAGPLLALICAVAQQQLWPTWLSLAGILIGQLAPITVISDLPRKAPPSEESQVIVDRALPLLIGTGLRFLGEPGKMVENPDMVQEFFGCMNTVATHFVTAFYRLPPGAFDSLMRCAVASLALQERYSLVAACNFLGMLITKTFAPSTPGIQQEHKDALINSYGRSILVAVLSGFAGVAPRSSTQNLIELMSTLLSKAPTECRGWVSEILFADDFMTTRAGPDAKERFAKEVLSSRSLKRMRDAAQQFSLIARGLEGTGFGMASV